MGSSCQFSYFGLLLEKGKKECKKFAVEDLYFIEAILERTLLIPIHSSSVNQHHHLCLSGTFNRILNKFLFVWYYKSEATYYFTKLMWSSK